MIPLPDDLSGGGSSQSEWGRSGESLAVVRLWRRDFGQKRFL
jgi:hypothetical protein